MFIVRGSRLVLSLAGDIVFLFVGKIIFLMCLSPLTCVNKKYYMYISEMAIDKYIEMPHYDTEFNHVIVS